MEKFFKYPWLVVGIITAITMFFAAQLPRVKLNNDMASMLPQENAAVITSDYLDETFGKSEGLFIGLERPYGNVFDQDFLLRLSETTEALKEIDIVKDVASILTLPYISSDGDSIFVNDLVDEDFSGTPDEITELKRRLASWELYDGQTVSADLSSTQIIVTLNTSTNDSMAPEVQEGVWKVRDITQEMFAGMAAVYVTGDPILRQTSNDAMESDLLLLVPLVILVVLGVLFFSFRRLVYVILPLLTVILSVIWTIGLMPLLGVKLSIISIVMPIILIAVGSAYGIHLVSHYKDISGNKTLTSDEHHDLVFEVLRDVAGPIMLAALTTMAGFFSFVFTFLKPVKEFGFFSTIGVGAALLVSITLIPALLLIRGPRTVKQKKTVKKFRFDTMLADILLAISSKKKLVILCTVIVLGVSFYGLGLLIVDNNMVEYFREDTDIYQSDRFISKYFGGTTQVTVAFEADSTEILLSPGVLTAVDGLGAYLTTRVPVVSNVTGFTDMVKRVNQVFNVDEGPNGIRASAAYADDAGEEFGFGGFGDFDTADASPFVSLGSPSEEDQQGSSAPAVGDTGITFAMLESAIGSDASMSARDMVRELERLTNYKGRSYYEIPSDLERYGKESEEELTRLIANYLVLVGDDADGGYSNDPLEPTAIRSVIQINSKWWTDTKAVIDSVEAYAAANFPDDVRVIIGGSAVLQGEITSELVSSQIVSIIVSILLVFIILSIANRSAIAGLLGSVPLSIAIMCNFGLMGFLGITLNMGTALVSSLAVGIGIDYTIHFMSFYKLEYKRGGDDFLRRTFDSCGKAILINVFSVGAGFSILALSNFRMITHIGGLIASSMVITAIVSLILMPVLFTTFKPKFIYGKFGKSR